MNGDIDPPEAFVDAHAALRPLIANARIRERFARYDSRAVAFKRLYNGLGGMGLSAVAVAMGALIYQLTLPKHFGAPESLPGLAAFAGALGLMAQVSLLVFRVKHRWLLARFAAERVRAIKFDAFRAVAARGVAAADAYVQGKLGALELQLRTGVGAYRAFDPDKELGEPPAPGAAPREAIEELKQTYQELRVDYQLRHATSQIDQLAEVRKLPAAFSEVAFWLAACVTFVDALLWLPQLSAFRGDLEMEALRHFAALSLFVLSAILFVFQRGRGDAPAIERYEEYKRTLEHAAAALEAAADADGLIEAVGESERAVLQELRAFAREAENSSYIF